MPLERLLLETESPDQPLAGHQGQRNEPCRIALVAQAIADLRGEPVEAIAAATTANACRLFGVEPPRDP
jgi:TatD DNase family protein